MTVEVARKTVNLGWQTACVVLLFVISTTAGAVKYFTNAEAEREKRTEQFTQIQASQKEILLELQKIPYINRRIDSLILSQQYVSPRQRSGGTRFVYEVIDENGRMILKKVK